VAQLREELRSHHRAEAERQRLKAELAERGVVGTREALRGSGRRAPRTRRRRGAAGGASAPGTPEKAPAAEKAPAPGVGSGDVGASRTGARGGRAGQDDPVRRRRAFAGGGAADGSRAGTTASAPRRSARKAKGIHRIVRSHPAVRSANRDKATGRSRRKRAPLSGRTR
jgi:hypothetical protein